MSTGESSSAHEERHSHPEGSLAGDYGVLVEGCGLLDRSDRGKLALSGSGAVEFLEGQVTNELADLRPGEGRYAAFLTHKGKMLGDLRILAAGEDPSQPPSELLVDTERIALQALFDMIRRFKVGYDVELHKRTIECSLLSLVGPRTRDVLSRVLDAPDSNALHPDTRDPDTPSPGAPWGALSLVEHAHMQARIAGIPVRLIATAEPEGVDLLCEAHERETVCRALVAGGSQPVQEGAAEILRVEHGRPRYGVDLDESVIPQEAGLNERAVSFTKGCYVGQETVARLYYKGKPNRHLRGLRLSAPLPAGVELRLDERTMGRLTSVALSPAHGPIALALVRREAEVGVKVTVGDEDASAQVVALPFA